MSRLIHVGPASSPGGLRLHCRRWTRQAFAEGLALPSLVNIEFCGIPAHAWEMATAESLLSPYGWPQGLHSSTNYSVFRALAWCFNPREIPQGRDLHVVEPLVGEILAPPGKWTLMYPMSVIVSRPLLPELSVEGSGGDSGSIDDGDDDRWHRRRRMESREVDIRAAAPTVTLLRVLRRLGTGWDQPPPTHAARRVWSRWRDPCP